MYVTHIYKYMCVYISIYVCVYITYIMFFLHHHLCPPPPPYHFFDIGNKIYYWKQSPKLFEVADL